MPYLAQTAGMGYTRENAYCKGLVMDQLRSQFFAAIMRLKKMETAFSAECDVQMTELAVLQGIVGSCGDDACCGVNLNVPEIQEKLQITKPAISYILNTLEKKRHITREIDPKDRRKISITATPEGIAAAAQSSQKCDEMWDTLIDRFGETDMRQLVALLTRLTDLRMELQREENECS